MKKLLALSITLVSGLSALQANDVAGSLAAIKSQNQPNECCTPCKLECVPQPKKCINCECYVPSFYDLQCDWGMTAYADFLYWYANEGNLSYAMVVQGALQAPGSTNIVALPVTTKHIGTNWDPGFRVGWGWNTGYDGWDVDVNYTWYKNHKTQSVSVPDFGVPDTPFFPAAGELAILDPWVSGGFFAGLGGEASYLFNSVAAGWKLYLNQVDLDLGRKYWLSKRFTMRPYAGGRAAWAKTMFRNHAIRVGDTDVIDATDTFKDKFWGVGLLTGFQPEWHFSSRFSLFSNLDIALLWGRFKMKKSEDYRRTTGGVLGTQINNNFYSNFSKMQAMLDLALGFRWTENWCDDRFRMYFDAGWEHHIWFDTNNRLKMNSPYVPTSITANTLKGFASYEEEVGNLMYGGLVVRARLDF